MSACQICGQPMTTVEEPGATLAVCSMYRVHPATFFGIERLPRLRKWRQEQQAGAPFDGVLR